MKIAILGYSGSGKSTLARELGECRGIPVLHLDSVRFLPRWKEREPAEERRIVSDFMDRNENWVIDGNYSSMCRERRLAEADRIVLLLFDRFSCLRRVVRRYREFRGQTRPDMGDGCIEKLDAEFVRWVLYKGRTRVRRQNYARIAAQYPEKTVILRNQRELTRFLQEEKPI